MNVKTILLAAGVSVVAAIIYRAYRKGRTAATATTADNLRDARNQTLTQRVNLGMDIDPNWLT
jgi:hypothetical protein